MEEGSILDSVEENKEWANDLGGSEAILTGLKMYQIVRDVEDGLGAVGGGSRGQTMTSPPLQMCSVLMHSGVDQGRGTCG